MPSRYEMTPQTRKARNSLQPLQIACASELVKGGSNIDLLAMAMNVSPPALRVRLRLYRGHTGEKFTDA